MSNQGKFFIKYWLVFFFAMGIGFLAVIGLMTLISPILERCL